MRLSRMTCQAMELLTLFLQNVALRWRERQGRLEEERRGVVLDLDGLR